MHIRIIVFMVIIISSSIIFFTRSYTQNSINPIISRDGIKFIYHNNHASSVYLKSSFDNWGLKYPFKKNINALGSWDGYWTLLLESKYELFQLKKGRYKYKMVVDGEFVTDTKNKNLIEDSYGYDVSYFDLKEDIVNYNTTKSPIKVKGQKNTYRFIYRNYNAKHVYLVGNFNNWNSYSLPMISKGDGIFEIILTFSKGFYYYNIIVDDNWSIDPFNAHSIKNKLNKTFSYFEVKED